MFSENFTISEKYSVIHKKYISSCDMMPWIYTSLYDSQYLPILESSVADKLNDFFKFRFLHTTHNLEDSSKNLTIEHLDGNILSYEIVNLFPYNIINQSNFFWKHFISSIGCEDIDLCRNKINTMTSETDELVTHVVSVTYNSDASFNSISIFDNSYDLNEFPNDTLHKLNNFVRDNADEFKGIIYFHPHSNDLRFKIMINFPTVDIYYSSNSIVPTDDIPQDLMVVSHTNKEHRETYLPYLLKNDIITLDQYDYLNELLTDNCRFDLEFIVGDDGEIKDLFVYKITVYEFEKLVY